MFDVVTGRASVLIAPVTSVISARGPAGVFAAGVAGAVGGASGSFVVVGGTTSIDAGAVTRGRGGIGGSGI